MMKDIHNNLPFIRPDFFTVLDWFFVIVVVAVLVWVYFLFFYIPSGNNKVAKKKKQKKAQVFKEPQFSFSKEMKKLEALVEQENWKEFSVHATGILKMLLEKKYKQYFLFATGKELQEIMSHKQITQFRKDQLEDFFTTLDPVKFARRDIDSEHSERIIKILKDFYE